MKKLLQSLLFLGLFCAAYISHAGQDQRVSHVVVVWLKKPGDAQMREKFINISRSLETLPGVLSRYVSAVISSDKPNVNAPS